MKSVVTIGLSGDAGCHVALVNLHKKLLKFLKSVKILHSYILIDEKEIPSECDLALIEGAIRTTHNEALVKEVREKSKCLVAFGSCACFGGIASLCNILNVNDLLDYVYQRTDSTIEGTVPFENLPKVQETVRPISDVVKVDYMIPGCPPIPEEIATAVQAILLGLKPELPKKNVCDECKKKRLGITPKTIKRVVSKPDTKQCLLEQGYLCLGPATRSGCKAPCPNYNMPCEGCRGPLENVPDQGLAMLDALSALTEKFAQEYSPTIHLGTFHRYTFAASSLAKMLRSR